MKDPQPIEIEAADVEQLIQKAEQGILDAAEQKRLVPLLRTLVWLERTLLSTRISLSRLRRILFGKKTENRPRTRKAPDTGEDGGGKGSGGSPDTGWDDPSAPNGKPTSGLPLGGQERDSNPKNRRGHGRRAAAAYPGAETVFCPHTAHQSGDRCQKCQRGRLYHLPPLVRLRFTAQPLALVTRFELERLRCNTCGALWVASMPPEASSALYP